MIGTLLASALAFAPTAAADVPPVPPPSSVRERAAFVVPEPGAPTAVGDVDGDGHGDVSLNDDGGRQFRLMLTGGSGTVRIQGIVNDGPLPAGDVNGDGIDDLAVPSVEIDRPGIIVAVLLGRRQWRDVDVGRRETRDIAIRVASPTPGIGQNDASVTAAGDLNGDGVDDLALTAADWDTLDRSGAPTSVWILFGRRGLRGAADVRKLGTNGFTIRGGRTDVGLGESVAPAGDVDGDGVDDLVVGAAYSSPTGLRNDTFERARGRAYLVYGRRGAPRSVDLRRPGAGATRIATGRLALLGANVAGIGDIDGDGLADVALGAPGFSPSAARRTAGALFVVAGRRGRPATIDVDRRATSGVRRIVGADADAKLGSSVAALGDVDGDGRPDIAIGAPTARGDDTFPGPGAVHVLHGGRGALDVDLRTPGGAVTTLHGSGTQALGGGLAAGTDLDRDGRAELLVPGALRCGERGEGDELHALELTEPPPAPRPGGGTPAADTVRAAGTAPLFGFGGADRLLGSSGADCLFGGPDGDTLLGAGGADTLYGDDGDDTVDGGPGRDLIYAGTGDDTIVAGPAAGRDDDDFATGQSGDDRIAGGAGKDRLAGDLGNDTLDGGDGDDELLPGPGRDTVNGGPGDDVVVTRDGEPDTVRCGPGRDAVVADPRDRLIGCERVSRRDSEPLPER